MNRGRSLAAVMRFVRWQLASRLRSEIEFEWVEGAKLVVRRGMTGATGNIYCGLHEYVEMAFLLHLLRPNDLFLDIGANVGSYTILASKVCKARSLAFEPDPRAARSLRRNVDQNEVGKLVEIRELALGAYNGEAGFTIGLDTTNHVANSSDEPARTVGIRRLDDVPGSDTPTLIKLDVEGYEENVLQGAGRTLVSPSLLAVQSELRSPAVERCLASFEFAPMFYDPLARVLSATNLGYPVSNMLFVRDVETIRKRVALAPTRRIFESDI